MQGILEGILEEIGYPTIAKVGEEASDAAWLIIQHAISLPTFMENCARLLEEAVNEKQANPVQLAYLMDRIAVLKGEAQRNGTQFDWDEKGVLNPQHFDNLEKVNTRRAKLGLNTLQQQTQIVRNQARMENQLAPENIVERKQSMQKWKKTVGWIKG